MSKIIGGPVTQEERSAVPAKDLWKGTDCGRFDPEKSDHIHGRGGAAPLLFSAGRGFDASKFCQVCGMRWAWCMCGEAALREGMTEQMKESRDHMLDQIPGGRTSEASC